MTLRWRIIRRCLNPHRSPELQLQIADEGLNLLVLIRRDELGRLQEFLVPFIGLCRRRPEHVAQQPVGDIDMGIAVFLGGILLQDRRDGDSQLRILRKLALPLIIAVDVREGHDLAAFLLDGGFEPALLPFAGGLVGDVEEALDADDAVDEPAGEGGNEDCELRFG